VDDMFTLDAVSEQTGIPLSRLREWCATGRLKCEREGGDWMIPPSELKQVAALAATQWARLEGDHPIALVVPAEVAPPNLADEVARRLGLEPASVAMSTLAMDGQDYVVAVWKDGHGNAGLPKVVKLAEEVGGELLDGAAPSAEPR
jgi:hypothetical protein